MKILVFQHVRVEHPGIFRDFWRQDGIPWDAVHLDEGEPIPDLEAYDVLVVMGGPQDTWQEADYPWLVPEKAAIRRWVEELRRPYLGICLGHQLLVAALEGGEVGLAPVPEVGLYDVGLTPAGRDDPLFQGIADSFLSFQWHGAEVKRLPAGTVVLAGSEACPVQALRWGRTAYGLQCHVEITDETVQKWGEIPAYRAYLERVLGTEGLKKLDRDTLEQLPAFKKTARSLYDNFTALISG